MNSISLGFDEIGIGGSLTLSCVARELKRIAPSTNIHIYSRHPELFLGNPNVSSANYYTAAPSREIHSPRMEDQSKDKHYNYYYCMDLGIDPVDIHPEMYLSRDEVDTTRCIYDLPKEYIVLHAQPSNIKVEYGRTARWTTTKDWYPERWEEVVRKMKVPVYQVRTKEEPYIHGCIDTVGTTVREACTIIAQSKLLLGCVSYSMHVAAATRKPAVILCGGREFPTQTCYPSRHIQIYAPLECSPCWKVDNCDRGMACMKKIIPEHVVSCVDRILEGRESTGIVTIR